MEGYIKLYRKIMDSSVWKNPETITVWVWCLLKATHKGYKFPFNGNDIELKPGQFLTGVEQGAKETLTSTSTYRTCIAYLKSTNRITTKSTNKFTIISIVNWEGYQKLTNKITSKLTNQQQTSNKPATTYKNDKNEKNIKEVIDFYVSSFKEEHSATPDTDGNDYELVERTLNKHPPEEIKEIINYYRDSEKCKKYKFKLSVALSKDTINDYILWAKAT